MTQFHEGRGGVPPGKNRAMRCVVVPPARPWPRNVGVLDFSGGGIFFLREFWGPCSQRGAHWRARLSRVPFAMGISSAASSLRRCYSGKPTGSPVRRQPAAA
jgi:hypothetical protein